MAHRRAKLTPLGRRLLVERITRDRWPVRTAAESMGVSAQTAYKWLARFRSEGLAGLEDRSSRPHLSPRATPGPVVARILELRRARRFGPHRIAYALGLARSSVYAVLARAGLSRLSDLDRVTRQVVRYQRERPGELVHIDVKRLGRIPAGGGWRALGRAATSAHRHKREPIGHDYLHVAVDDRSRVAYIEAHADERAPTCAGFIARAIAFFARHRIRVEAVMTDNAFSYVHGQPVQQALARQGVAHLRIRPHRPQQNGKVERFNRTLIEEWAYQRPYRSNAERLASLPGWVDAYNRRRPHTALDGDCPMDVLIKNVPGNYT